MNSGWGPSARHVVFCWSSDEVTLNEIVPIVPCELVSQTVRVCDGGVVCVRVRVRCMSELHVPFSVPPWRRAFGTCSVNMSQNSETCCEVTSLIGTQESQYQRSVASLCACGVPFYGLFARLELGANVRLRHGRLGL